jgi:GNAT superfamily N-acetyltransferase
MTLMYGIGPSVILSMTGFSGMMVGWMVLECSGRTRPAGIFRIAVIFGQGSPLLQIPWTAIFIHSSRQVILYHTMTVTIEPAASFPDLHETISAWLWAEWGTPQNHGLYRSLVAHSRPDSIPAIYVAFLDGKTVGTVGLLRTDLLSRQEFTPWMAVLYVVPAFRGQGIAAALQSHAMAEARRMGFSEIFLYTKMIGFYEKRGWVFMETDVDDHGDAIRIYRKSL